MITTPKQQILVAALANILLSSFWNIAAVANADVKSSLNSTTILAFQPTVATWFGPPDGAGSTGGACEFEDFVGKAPYFSMVAAGAPAIYQNGFGCGACYQIFCTQNPACSGRPVRVTIADECPGCGSPFQFDMSGRSFGLLAKPGQANQLRNAGKINIQYQRVPCNYPGTPITFKIDRGATPFYFAAAILFVNGDGDLANVEIQIAGSNQFSPMSRVSGGTFKFNPNGNRGPYTIRLTSGESKRVIVAQNVIPFGWTAGSLIRSNVNF